MSHENKPRISGMFFLSEISRKVEDIEKCLIEAQAIASLVFLTDRIISIL